MALVQTRGDKDLYLISYGELTSLLDSEYDLQELYKLISKYCTPEMITIGSHGSIGYVIRDPTGYGSIAKLILSQHRHYIDMEVDVFIHDHNTYSLLHEAIEVHKVLSRGLFSLKPQYRTEFLFSFNK